MSLSLAARRARLLVVRDAIISTGTGALWLIDGAMASSPEAAASGNVLAVIELTAAEFTVHATDAELVVSAVGHAMASGQPTWGRYVDGNGDGVLDQTVGQPGSGAQIIITDGQPVPSSQVWVGGEITLTHTMTE